MGLEENTFLCMSEMPRHVTTQCCISAGSNASRSVFWSSACPGCFSCVSSSRERQREKVKYCLCKDPRLELSIQLCYRLLICSQENYFISVFRQSYYTKHLAVPLIFSLLQPYLFIPKTPWSRCSVCLCILCHKSSVLVGWAVEPQAAVIVISRLYHG